jgi:putative endonuclease
MPRPDTATRRIADARGRRAEALAAWWLRLKGYRVLARRVKTPVGEVDLVVRRGRTLAFVEVKARDRLDKAAMALHPAAQQRIARAVRMLLARYARAGDAAVRIDAVLIVPGHLPRHLEAVWQGER